MGALPDVIATLTTYAEQLTASPWFAVVVLVAAVLDAVLPVLPSETLIIAAGVLGVADVPQLLVVAAAAALGAFLGDHLCYAIGRLSGPAILARADVRSRRRRSYDAARRALDSRGGTAIVAGRHVPGGRTAITLLCGATGFPRARFALFAAVAATLWAALNGAIGAIGGVAFAADPLLGLVVGMSTALAVTVVAEAVRRIRRARTVRLPAQ
jgi:membrane protein DedA with SNARE-associated domain